MKKSKKEILKKELLENVNPPTLAEMRAVIEAYLRAATRLAAEEKGEQSLSRSNQSGHKENQANDLSKSKKDPGNWPPKKKPNKS